MTLNIIKYQITKPFITDKHKYYILDRYKFPSSLCVDSTNDRKEFVCGSNVNGSIFFKVCADNDVGSINYCLEECNANLEMTDTIKDYKKIFKCMNEQCGQYNCLSVNFPRREKITPLMYAILKGNYWAVRYLLSLGANVNYQTECFGITPLLLACRMRNIQLVKLLVSYQADILHRDVLNRTCLIHAVSNNMVCLYYNESFMKHSFFLKNLFYVMSDNIPSNRTLIDFINDSELVRNYTVLHLISKFFNKSLFDFALKHGAKPSLSKKVYKNNNLKTVIMYQNIIEGDNDNQMPSYNIPQQNFLSYCLCNIRFNCHQSLVFLSHLIEKNIESNYEYFSRRETSDACLIAYLEFLKKYYFHKEIFVTKFTNHIIKDESNDYLIKNLNYPHFMDDNYFNFCINLLGCNNKIIYNILLQRNGKNKHDAKFDNVIKDSLTLLNSKVVLGNRLWKLIFENLLTINNFDYFDILSKCFENQIQNKKFFNQFNKTHVYNVMFYVFEGAYILTDASNVKKFKSLLQLIESMNRDIKNFSIFYEAMRYVKRKIYKEEEADDYNSNYSHVLTRLIGLLNLIKSFKTFDQHKKIIANSDTIGVNSVHLIKFEHFYLDTPLAIALLCATKCERSSWCTHSNKEKYMKLVEFFIEQDDDSSTHSDMANNVERQHRYSRDYCFLYFYHNYYVLKSFFGKSRELITKYQD